MEDELKNYRSIITSNLRRILHQDFNPEDMDNITRKIEEFKKKESDRLIGIYVSDSKRKNKVMTLKKFGDRCTVLGEVAQEYLDKAIAEKERKQEQIKYDRDTDAYLELFNNLVNRNKQAEQEKWKNKKEIQNDYIRISFYYNCE